MSPDWLNIVTRLGSSNQSARFQHSIDILDFNLFMTLTLGWSMFFYKMYLSLTFVFQTNRPIVTGETGSSNHFWISQNENKKTKRERETDREAQNRRGHLWKGILKTIRTDLKDKDWQKYLLPRNGESKANDHAKQRGVLKNRKTYAGGKNFFILKLGWSERKGTENIEHKRGYRKTERDKSRKFQPERLDWLFSSEQPVWTLDYVITGITNTKLFC